MTSLSEISGLGVIAVACFDIVVTVLSPEQHGGPLSRRAVSGVYRTALAASTLVGSRKPILCCGPLAVITLVAGWGGLLLFGCGLYCWPHLGDSILAASGETPTHFAAAVYHAGTNLTTLGSGDLLPQTDHMRLHAIVAAALGFGVLTLSLTYVNSVYRALQERSELARLLDALSGFTGESTTLAKALEKLGPETVLTLCAKVASYAESHRRYFVLHYFFFNDPRFSMARVLYLTLDSSSFLECSEGENSLGTAAKTLRYLGMDLVSEAEALNGKTSLATPDWGQNFSNRFLHEKANASAGRGSEAAVADASIAAYTRCRRQWIKAVMLVARTAMLPEHAVAPRPDVVDS